jgi:hypothetical protein
VTASLPGVSEDAWLGASGPNPGGLPGARIRRRGFAPVAPPGAEAGGREISLSEERNRLLGTNTVTMDELTVVRDEIEAGNVSPHSLVLLFNAASDAEHAGDLATLEKTLDLARAIAGMAGESLQAEATRLATICEQSLAGVRARQEASAPTESRDRMLCPECGNEVSADAVRCRRCGHRFI